LKRSLPNNLAPKSSTTAPIAMGDAWLLFIDARDFLVRFCKYHPGGALEKNCIESRRYLFSNQKPQ